MLKKVAESEYNLNVCEWDTVSIVDDDGRVLCTHEIDRDMTITSASIYEFEDEFGLKEGFAGVVGNNG